MDRCLVQSRCEECDTWKFLDSLIRLEFVDPTTQASVFSARVCQHCKEDLVAWYWEAEPTYQRYYHPA